MKTQMVKWGNSLAVRIPKPVVEDAKLKEGDSLEIEAAAEGHVELRRATKIPLRRDFGWSGGGEGSC
jgi:antitoxin MazE